LIDEKRLLLPLSLPRPHLSYFFDRPAFSNSFVIIPLLPLRQLFICSRHQLHSCIFCNEDSQVLHWFVRIKERKQVYFIECFCREFVEVCGRECVEEDKCFGRERERGRGRMRGRERGREGVWMCGRERENRRCVEGVYQFSALFDGTTLYPKHLGQYRSMICGVHPEGHRSTGLSKEATNLTKVSIELNRD